MYSFQIIIKMHEPSLQDNALSQPWMDQVGPSPCRALALLKVRRSLHKTIMAGRMQIADSGPDIELLTLTAAD